MMRNMITSFLKEEKVITTDSKAKLLKSAADKMITLAKRGDLHARRQAAMVMHDRSVAKKLFDEISPPLSGPAGRIYEDCENRKQSGR